MINPTSFYWIFLLGVSFDANFLILLSASYSEKITRWRLISSSGWPGVNWLRHWMPTLRNGNHCWAIIIADWLPLYSLTVDKYCTWPQSAVVNWFTTVTIKLRSTYLLQRQTLSHYVQNGVKNGSGSESNTSSTDSINNTNTEYGTARRTSKVWRIIERSGRSLQRRILARNIPVPMI